MYTHQDRLSVTNIFALTRFIDFYRTLLSDCDESKLTHKSTVERVWSRAWMLKVNTGDVAFFFVISTQFSFPINFQSHRRKSKRQNVTFRSKIEFFPAISVLITLPPFSRRLILSPFALWRVSRAHESKPANLLSNLHHKQKENPWSNSNSLLVSLKPTIFSYFFLSLPFIYILNVSLQTEEKKTFSFLLARLYIFVWDFYNKTRSV